MADKAGFPTTWQEVLGAAGRSQCATDVTVETPNRTLTLDVSIANPMAPSALQGSGTRSSRNTNLFAAKTRENEKRYALSRLNLNPNPGVPAGEYTFKPVVFETSGAIGKEALLAFKGLAEAADETGTMSAEEFMAELKLRIALAIHGGNAKLFAEHSLYIRAARQRAAAEVGQVRGNPWRVRRPGRAQAAQ